IESHWHMWSSLGRNFISEGYEYFPAKWDTSAHYEPEDFYRSVLLGAVEALNAGITTIHNWSHNTRTPEHADAELRAHQASVVRRPRHPRRPRPPRRQPARSRPRQRGRLPPGDGPVSGTEPASFDPHDAGRLHQGRRRGVGEARLPRRAQLPDLSLPRGA